MTYERFEDLPDWNAAIELAVRVIEWTGSEEFRGHGALRDQVVRAVVSISNNIGEGFERGTTAELLAFLYIARGSAGEVRSMLCLLEKMSQFHNFKFEISNLKLRAEGISRQLRGWADHLQNTKIKGQRHLNEEARRVERARKSQAEFLEYLRRVRESGAAEPLPPETPGGGER